MERVPFGKFGFVSKTTVEWMRGHLSFFLGGAALALLISAWGVYQWNSGSPKDFFTVEKTFNQWSGSRDEQLMKLQKILKQHPELRAKYDGRIAQKLLLSSEQGLAASFSKSALKRIGNFSPYYTQFSHCSLLIGEKKFQEALILSMGLKQALDEDHQFWETKSALIKHGQMLYGYNLLRIAFLEQALAHRSEEIEAWKTFKEYAGGTDPRTYELISQNFQQDDISLQDFIKYREEALTSLEEKP